MKIVLKPGIELLKEFPKWPGQRKWSRVCTHYQSDNYCDIRFFLTSHASPVELVLMDAHDKY